MKVCILGATGMTGRRLLEQALNAGHLVTAVVRSAALEAEPKRDNLIVKVVDFADEAALREVMAGQDAVINAAGYLSDEAHFAPLVQRVIAAADAALGPGGRFWMFAGAALLDVPGTSMMTMTLPGVPQIYRAHAANYDAVLRTGLDWSVLCPGPMIESPDGQATPGLVLSEEVWPVPRPAYTRFLPRAALALAFRQALPRLTIYYEDAAAVVLSHLARGGRFARRRVGVALPAGQTRHKPLSTRPAPAPSSR